MKIAIRIDDITPFMDWERFWAFKELLDEYGIKPLIGVVPDNRDENLNRMRGDIHKTPYFWEYIKELQSKGWTVALHGYMHLYTKKKGGLFPLNRFSEFAGVPYERQCRMVAEGRKIFAAHGIQSDIFMAPAHSYDRNTLKALKEEGFTRITDGFGSRPYIREGITFYPISFRLEGSLKKKQGTTTMVVHTNTMDQKDLERYRRIFQQEEVISYSQYLQEAAAQRGAVGCLAEYVLACIKHLLVKLL